MGKFSQQEIDKTRHFCYSARFQNSVVDSNTEIGSLDTTSVTFTCHPKAITLQKNGNRHIRLDFADEPEQIQKRGLMHVEAREILHPHMYRLMLLIAMPRSYRKANVA